MHTILLILSVSIIGGIIGLDRTAAGQFMISQPIVAGPLIGWFLGDVITGLIVGAVLELLWVMDMPIGTFVPADSTIAAVWATAVSIIGSGGAASASVIGFSILFTIAIVPVTMKADAIIRKRNAMLAKQAVLSVGGDAASNLARAHLTGLFAFFLKSFLIYIIFIPLGVAVVGFYLDADVRIHSGMELFLKVIMLLGIASASRKLTIALIDPFMLSGFILAAGLSLLWGAHALIIAIVVAFAGWLGVRYRVW